MTAQSTMPALKGAAVPRPRNHVDTSTYAGRVAIRIRELREAAGLDVRDCAKRITKAGYKIGSSTLYHWENGGRQPQLDAIPYIAKALRVRIAELFPD